MKTINKEYILTRLFFTQKGYDTIIKNDEILSKLEKDAKVQLSDGIIEVMTIKRPKKEILHVRKKINYQNFKTPFQVYTQMLKIYFKQNCKIYVLAKKRQKNTLEKFWNLFYFNVAKEISKEMENFYPSYLIEYEDKKVLLTFNKECLDIYELNVIIEDKRFNFEGYNYIKANEIRL